MYQVLRHDCVFLVFFLLPAIFEDLNLFLGKPRFDGSLVERFSPVFVVYRNPPKKSENDSEADNCLFHLINVYFLCLNLQSLPAARKSSILAAHFR